MAAEFDERMRVVLLPHVRDGALHYQVRTRIEWGRPLAA
jgi:hypothetical protein